MKKLFQIKYILPLLIVAILLGVSVFILKDKFFPEKKVHYHAGFVVFNNNKKLDFSDFKYMYEKPCTLNGKEDESTENDQLEKAHLHDNVGDVIHVEREGAIWRDIFANMHYTIDFNKTSGYLNGKKVPNYQSQPIKSDDSLVIFIGENDINKNLQQAPTKTYIEQMAKKSKTCGD